MTDEEKEAVIADAARLNANAIVGRLQFFQEELDKCHQRIDQQAQQIAHLEGRLNLESQLRVASQKGRGPTG